MCTACGGGGETMMVVAVSSGILGAMFLPVKMLWYKVFGKKKNKCDV